jgi:hypothetical protein
VRLQVSNRTGRRFGLTQRRRGAVTIATKRVRLRKAGSKVVRLRVTRRSARKLRRAKAVRLKLSTTARALEGKRETRRAAVSFTARR